MEKSVPIENAGNTLAFALGFLKGCVNYDIFFRYIRPLCPFFFAGVLQNDDKNTAVKVSLALKAAPQSI